MKIFLAIFLFIAIIIESTVAPFPLTLLCILLLASFMEKEVILWAFLGGLLLDIFSLRLWGASSLFFLSMVAISEYYRKKFHQEGSFIHQLVIILLFVVLYSFAFYRYIHLWQLVLTLVLAVTLLFIFKRFFSFGEKRRRLSV